MNNKFGINMETAGDKKKEITAVVNIMLMLEEFSGEKAVEILTGVLCSVITTTANDGKQDEITDAVIKALKDGMKVMETTKPMFAVICLPKKNQSAHPGGNPNLN